MAVGININQIKNATPEEAKAKGIQKFTTLILNTGLKFANQITPRIVKEIENVFPDGECPPKEDIQKALTLRNNVVDQANNISDKLDSFSKIVLGVSSFLAVFVSLIKGINTAKSILTLVATGLSSSPIPNPIVNQILGALNTVSNTLNTIQQNAIFDSLGKQKIIPLKSAVDGASLSLSLANSYIEDFVDQLTELDNKISSCDDGALLPPLSPQLILAAEFAKKSRQSINETAYNGFNIEVEEVPFSPTVNRKRAIGLTPDGIKLIETPLSFATNDQILINELKFIIDRDNLKAI
jgi:hypothetical protein